MKSLGVVILAAGKGTRMKTSTPKALVHSLGRPLIDYVLDAVLGFAESSKLELDIGVVIGHKKEELEEWHDQHSHKSRMKLAWQREQKGTADALKACFNELPEFKKYEYTLVACADTPLLKSSDFLKLFDVLESEKTCLGVAATFNEQHPLGYGRIVRSQNGFQIVEEKDASDEQRKITEVNSGVYIVKTSHIEDVLGKINNDNKSGEFYLTDLFKDNYPVRPVLFPSGSNFLGVNNLEQLNNVSETLLTQKIKELQLSGVTFLRPQTTYLDSTVEIAEGVTIFPGVTILGKTKIGPGCVIESGSFLKNAQIENDVQVLANSYIEETHIQSAAVIGPMARLRPQTVIGKKAKVGNFVEIKKSHLKDGAKVSHLSYVGDAEIGEDTNIGCGFITCNYDGVNKHKTIIGKNTFIGSDCQVIAPIEIGDHAFVAAGSTITKSVPSEAFAIARGQQQIKEGAAKRFLKVKKS
ncbi:MAG TPA: bifunctional UDP-N-acetylglucosamine diphosphorylase/glucosamine-1-phosphate N-acetyltransferase GlmU [Bacteriovoracaceae bacterium]|nr:bifunctional UDP-N-acetylglucosamine diphosphorylase/glucosamine-1-phosphate N-acetyltransferase GlmU [Bacteriovoracaceae bacterium]